jgi:hypothetical protein
MCNAYLIHEDCGLPALEIDIQPDGSIRQKDLKTIGGGAIGSYPLHRVYCASCGGQGVRFLRRLIMTLEEYRQYIIEGNADGRSIESYTGRRRQGD